MKKLITLALAGMLMAPAAAQAGGGQTFRIGVRVTDPVGTTVLVRWRVSCANGGIARQTKGEFRAEVPVARQIPQSLQGATSCNIRAVAWNVGHHHGATPHVETWVVAL